MAVVAKAPHVRDSFNVRRAMRWMAAALVPCLFMALYNTGYHANLKVAVEEFGVVPGWRGTVLGMVGMDYDPSGFWAAVAHGALYFLPVLAVAVVVGGLWVRVFARLRNRPTGEGLLVIALLFTLGLPPSIPLWQAALGISFAVVVGREIFGGTGRNFLNPAVTGLAFLYVTYPKEMVSETAWTVVDALTAPTLLNPAVEAGGPLLAWLPFTWLQTFVGLVPGTFGTTSTVACLLGATVLLYRRIASARIMLGVLAGMFGTVLLLSGVGPWTNAFVGISWYWHLTLGSFAFGAVFLATDPASAAMTDTGRWIYGLSIGAMVVLIRVGNEAHPDGVIFAVLLGNIFAPLIDHLVVRANIRRRIRRNA
jgi:Na+-transporting NADH:ubiquinone oxidoreductase subunit B